VLHDTALASAKFVKSLVPKRLNRSKKKPWFSKSCHDLKNAVKKYCFLLNKYPDNGSYRKAFYSFLSKCRRKCKIEERKYKQQLCDDDIYSNIKNDPRTFWNVINKIGNIS
jgi:hypothetical protein